MKEAIWLSKNVSSIPSTALVGGKAMNLFKLIYSGINVPTFGVITTNSYKYWLEKGRLPEKLLETIKEEISGWSNQKYFAVRSSMNQEDGGVNSFAGIMETYLYVEPESFEEKIVECFKSLTSDRSNEYLKKRGKEGSEVLGAVIIQTMIDSDVSGVAFSRCPTNDSSLILIESCFGLCEGIVSGQVDVDSYYMDRFENQIKVEISVKEDVFHYNENLCKVEKTQCEPHKKEISSLNNNQMKILFQEILRIEKHYKIPVDIEWTFGQEEPDNLIILQTRPITKKFPNLHYFVDTNLAESYPGLSSPLTGSIIPRLYNVVFLQAFDLLGTSPKRINLMKKHYKKLVEYHGGHLYYNLKSYYAVLYSLPGGEKNVENWHRMIGGNVSSLSFDFREVAPGIFEILKNSYNILKFALFNKRCFKPFYQKGEEFRKEYFSKLDETEELRELTKLFTSLISKDFGFGITVINDLLIMIFLKLFESMAYKKGLNDSDIVSCLRTEAELESLKPLEALNSCLDRMSDKMGFLKSCEMMVSKNEFIEYKDLEEDLINLNFLQETELMIGYLNEYGDRCFEELKFESLSFKESPFEFIKLLSWQANYQNEEIKINTESDSTIELKGLIKWVWKKLHSFIEQREKSRLVRGQFYSLSRSIFFKIIKKLRIEDGFKDFHIKDYFGLNLESIIDFANSKTEIDELKNTINNNIKWLESSPNFPEYFCTDSSSDPYFLKNYSEVILNSDEKIIKGLGASDFEAQGEILVLNHPHEALKIKNLSDKVLVTKNTDPAWVFIMSKCAGLISEKGSLLSHTAIIGRELKLPTVVGIKHATGILKTGQKVIISGKEGHVEILSDPN